MRKIIKAVTVAMMFVGVLAVAPAAHAEIVSTSSTVDLPSSALSDDASGIVNLPSAPTTEACSYTAFGYTANIKCGTDFLWFDYNGDTRIDEWVGIRSDRAVVHVWPGSRGWPQLTNGWADNVYSNLYQASNGYRLVKVTVNGSGLFCTSYMPGRNWYNFWKC